MGKWNTPEHHDKEGNNREIDRQQRYLLGKHTYILIVTLQPKHNVAFGVEQYHYH